MRPQPRQVWAILIAAAAVFACKSGDDSANTQTAADTTAGPDPVGDFAFSSTPPGAYRQRDRVGMPVVNAALLASQAYNEASPSDDQQGTFVPPLREAIIALRAALDDDLSAAGLVPCVPSECVEQAAPLVVPDQLKVDLGQPAGFPNGRQLTDPVVDITLAVLLLELADGQGADTLANLPLGPPANDVEFSPTFPYLAEPH